MSGPEFQGEGDPRLVDPDVYFGEHYGDVVIRYGDRELTLGSAIQFEQLVRTPEKISSDPKEKRANVFIGMLKEAGALRPEDDITYPEVV